MTILEFNEILDFAVEREKEAVQYYRDLQKETHFKGQLDFLKELESMELGHIIVIENLRNKQITELEIKHVPNLKISEYLTADLEKLDLTYPNLLIKAMKREELSVKLYTDMSERFPDSSLQQLFQKLASEEAGHKHKFEVLYDEWISQGN